MQISERDSTLTHAEVCSYDNAHGDSEVNCVSWCPRPNMHDILATAGDDGLINIWKVTVSRSHLHPLVSQVGLKAREYRACNLISWLQMNEMQSKVLPPPRK